LISETRKQELMQRAYDSGYAYEKKFGGCGQCVFAALQDTLDKHTSEWDFVFQSLTAHAGGIGRQGDGSCGAYVGAAAFIGLLLGRSRDNFADPDKLRRKTEALVDQLHERFLDAYGSITCHSIHRNLYGRPFYIKDQDEFVKFEAAGAHDTGCTSVVGNAAQWTVEILTDAGLT
jgi:C_GCAxxG_C_C family probable redox protein